MVDANFNPNILSHNMGEAYCQYFQDQIVEVYTTDPKETLYYAEYEHPKMSYICGKMKWGSCWLVCIECEMTTPDGAKHTIDVVLNCYGIKAIMKAVSQNPNKGVHIPALFQTR